MLYATLAPEYFDEEGEGRTGEWESGNKERNQAGKRAGISVRRTGFYFGLSGSA